LTTKSKTERGIKHPKTLTLLREKLGQKAKREPKFRFYSLYGHLLRNDVLWTAWKISKRNGGGAGIDGTTFKDIEESPEEVPGFLNSIQQTLKEKTYRSAPVKRVYIPKGNGKQRPLGLITIKERTIHTPLKMIRQRVFGIALGYEDLNDHTDLRKDEAFQTAVDSDDPLASSSTLCRVVLQKTLYLPKPAHSLFFFV